MLSIFVLAPILMGVIALIFQHRIFKSLTYLFQIVYTAFAFYIFMLVKEGEQLFIILADMQMV